MSAVDMNMVYKSVLEADRAAVVICDLNHNLEGTLPEIGEATCDHHEHDHHEGHDCAHGGICHG